MLIGNLWNVKILGVFNNFKSLGEFKKKIKRFKSQRCELYESFFIRCFKFLFPSMLTQFVHKLRRNWNLDISKFLISASEQIKKKMILFSSMTLVMVMQSLHGF